MKVLVATTAGAGHFGPMIPFANACALAGHDVRVAAPASFDRAVMAAGFTHVPLGDPDPEERAAIFRRITDLPPEDANVIVVRDVFAGIAARSALPAMDAAVREWAPDLILRETTEFSSYVVAERAGIPHVQVSIGLVSMDDYVVSTVGDALDELGAPRGLAGIATGPRLLSTPATLDHTARDGHGHRFRFESDPLPGTLPMERLDGAPLVYASFGTVAATMGLFPDLYRAVIATTSTLPIQLIVTVGDAGDPAALAPLPDNVRVERFVRQPDVMPHASAVIGHGGFGTTMHALAAGVPVISIPLFAMDQYLNAEAVAAVGAGITLPSGPAATAALRDTLERILDDDAYATAAGTIATEIEHLPPTSEAVSLLERVAESR